MTDQIKCIFMADRHACAAVVGDKDYVIKALLKLHEDDHWCGVHGRWEVDGVAIDHPTFHCDYKAPVVDSIRQDVCEVLKKASVKETRVKKKLVIESCGDCPHFDNEYYNYEEMCMKLWRKIPLVQGDRPSLNTYPIPCDCPLEDAHD